jgi:hypothetical protein
MSNPMRKPQFFTLLFLLFSLGSILVQSCNKSSSIPPRSPYTIIFNNEFTLLEAKFGVFITDDEGNVDAFSWLDGRDTTHFGLRFSDFDKYNCTIVKISINRASGTPDTLVEMTTYDHVPHNTVINLRELEYEQQVNIKMQFKNLSSLDSLIIPEGEALVMPTQSNNYFGNFKVDYTGDFWLRAKFNGEPEWKYLVYKNFSQTPNTLYIDPNLMSTMTKLPHQINLPFDSKWKHYIEGIFDIDDQRVMPLADVLDVPDDNIPTNNYLRLYQPDDLFVSGYRLKLNGVKEGSKSYAYGIDRYYSILPNSIELPDFNIEPTLVNDQNRIGIRCVGNFDALVVTRSIAGATKITWSVYIPPVQDGDISNELPQVPKELASLYPKLANKQFDSGTSVRAERYKLLFGFEDVQLTIFDNTDVFWQPKNELSTIEKVF